jgi:ATP-dependent helicase HrpB
VPDRLPIDDVLGEIVAAARAGNVVLEAPPGAGKTTRVPPALRDVVDGEIVVLEPRRIAARLAAKRVAEELGEPIGKTIGYRVRFEDVPGARVNFVTEGVLTRRLMADPSLGGVGAIVLDEMHERHLHGDLALALARRLQQHRRDLRIVAMSATLDAAPVATFLAAPRVRAEGTRFDVEIVYADRPDDRPLEAQVASAVRRVLSADDDDGGDVLVFLPGAREIERAREAIAPAAKGVLVLPLHGELPPAEQDRAVRRSAGEPRKVILSTNVAETSITIDGVTAVIDGGLARIASHSPWTGVPRLEVKKVSQASAAQRAGRAGRTRAGRCFRLYTKHDHDTRPPHDAPEIRRLDLAELVLALHAAGVRDARALAWLEAPPEVALAHAETLLTRLGAVDRAGALTAIGRRMQRLPLHPRLARVVVEGEARGCASEACAAAACVAERDAPWPERRSASGGSDLIEAIEAVRAEPRRSPMVERARRQLERIADLRAAPHAKDVDAALGIAVLSGFPDRVARRRRVNSNELLLAAGGTAELSHSSVVRDAELLVAVDVEARAKTIVRVASAVEPEWLVELHADALSETSAPEWNDEGSRVEIVHRLAYDGLTLEERRSPPGAGDDEAKIAELLAEHALSAGLAKFIDVDALRALRHRVAFAAAHGAPSLPSVADDRALVTALCRGRTSFADLRAGSSLPRLAADQMKLVDRLAPEKITLAAGRSVKIHYEPDKPPWIESRLQDFFGMTATPTIAGVPLVLHLLAPNQRAVQVTTDLAGFWTRHYPAIRKELMRKYPKHKWPEFGDGV